jgi:hypothetical protein
MHLNPTGGFGPHNLNNFMSDIIMTIPSYDDDRETWSQNHVWAHDDGTYTLCDECGDHESLETEDVPSFEEHDRKWREYTQWALETGTDPLGNFFVRHSIKTRERWQFRLAKTLVGPRLIDARHAGRRYTLTHLDELPGQVRTFLNLDSSGKLGDFATWDELIELLPDIKAGRWFVAHIEEDMPRQKDAIARDIRRIARKSLR